MSCSVEADYCSFEGKRRKGGGDAWRVFTRRDYWKDGGHAGGRAAALVEGIVEVVGALKSLRKPRNWKQMLSVLL